MTREETKKIILDKFNWCCDIGELKIALANILAKLHEVEILSEDDIREFSIYD